MYVVDMLVENYICILIFGKDLHNQVIVLIKKDPLGLNDVNSMVQYLGQNHHGTTI